MCLLVPAPVSAASGLETLKGTWGVDVLASHTLIGELPTDPVDVKMLETFLRGIRLEFNTAAGQITTSMGGETKTESFSVESDDGVTVVLRKGAISVPYEIRNRDQIVGGTGKGGSKRLVFRRLR